MLYVLCLHILASSRFPQYNLGRQTPHSWGGSVTVGSHKTPIFTTNITKFHIRNRGQVLITHEFHEFCWFITAGTSDEGIASIWTQIHINPQYVKNDQSHGSKMQGEAVGQTWVQLGSGGGRSAYKWGQTWGNFTGTLLTAWGRNILLVRGSCMKILGPPATW
jgi:hypothetical protein